jgi:hypothetical protein
MIASSLRPLMMALRLRARRRGLNRQELLKLLVDANRRSGLRRPVPRRQAGVMAALEKVSLQLG